MFCEGKEQLSRVYLKVKFLNIKNGFPTKVQIFWEGKD
jgi:hypothetical protein